MNIGTAHEVVKSNTPNDTFTMLLVTTTVGTVHFDQIGGNDIELTDVPVGVWIPVGNAINVRTTSTAVGIVVF